MEQRKELPPHPVAAEAVPYLAAMSKEERELHNLAVKMLGSSYFVERTHGFRKWLAKTTGAGSAGKK